MLLESTAMGSWLGLLPTHPSLFPPNCLALHYTGRLSDPPPRPMPFTCSPPPHCPLPTGPSLANTATLCSGFISSTTFLVRSIWIPISCNILIENALFFFSALSPDCDDSPFYSQPSVPTSPLETSVVAVSLTRSTLSCH